MTERSESFLQDARALVTGGGTGVGRAVCLRLALAGAKAVAVSYSRSADEADATIAQLRELGCAAIAVRADVGDDDDVARMTATVLEEFGGLSVLVNCAGVTRRIPLDDLDSIGEEDWRMAIDVNLRGAFRCIRACRPSLLAARGAVINVGSIAGHRAVGSSLPYGVGKAALTHMTRMLARALSPHVRVNSVSPGTLDTRWLPAVMGDEAAQVFLEQERKSIPLGRVADPGDVADAVVGLLQCRMVTGEDLIIDGGKHLVY